MLIFELINADELSLYINPRFTTLLKISTLLLIPLMFVQAFAIVITQNTSHSHCSSWTYLPFILLLLLVFAFPGNTLNASMVNNKSLNNQPASSPNTYEMSRPLADKLRGTSKIEVNDHDYAEIMNELQFFSQDYIGKQIQVTGFVFRGPADTGTQFSLVRYVVVCCTADALPYGILCETKDAAKYQNGTWLSIKGIVQTSKYEEQTVPSIKITSLQQVSEPKNPYVFPLSQ